MQGFDIANPPFDRLSHRRSKNSGRARHRVFPPGRSDRRPGTRLGVAACRHQRGQWRCGRTATFSTVLGPKDSFDSRALVHGAAGEDFVAAEETLCHLIPRHIIVGLIHRNPGFAAFFYADVSRKLDAFADQRKAEGVDSVLRARVRDARYRGAVFIDGGSTIEAGRTLHAGQRHQCPFRAGR